MAGGGDARRQARESAMLAQQQIAELERQRRELQRQAEIEKQRAQRIMMRGIRAAGGGYFETAADERSTDLQPSLPSGIDRWRGFFGGRRSSFVNAIREQVKNLSEKVG